MLAAGAQLCFCEVFQQRKQILEVDTKEVVPKEIARAQETCQQAHSVLSGEEGHDVVRKPFFRDLAQELIEVTHGLRGVRGFGQKTRKLFDQRYGYAQALLIPALLDLSAP